IFKLLESLKIRTAWRKDFFDTLGADYISALTRPRCVPGPGGSGGWVGRIYNAPLQNRLRCSGRAVCGNPLATGGNFRYDRGTWRRGGGEMIYLVEDDGNIREF